MKCVFCDIARGEAPAYKVYENRDLMVILDIYPVEKGHLLVIPKEHYESAHDTPPRLLAKVFVVAGALARIYRTRLGAPGVNIVSNSGRAAGQVVFHFHVHVIPRFYSASLRRVFSGRHSLTREEAEEVLSALRPHIDLIDEMLEEADLS